MRRRAATVAVLLLGTAGLLQACQSNPEPPPLETAALSPPAPPSSSPTEAAPTLPAAAKGRSEAAAKAFVRHYVETVNYAMRTGDTVALSRLARPRCRTCHAIVHRIDEVYRAGGRLEGQGWSILSLTFLPSTQQNTALVAAGVALAPQVALASEGATPTRSPESRGNLDFRLVGRQGTWHVASLEATQ